VAECVSSRRLDVTIKPLRETGAAFWFATGGAGNWRAVVTEFNHANGSRVSVFVKRYAGTGARPTF
jgi:hypothetical protein